MVFSNSWVAINGPKLSVVDPDGSLAFQWAVVLTDPAADAQVTQDRRALHGACLPRLN